MKAKLEQVKEDLSRYAVAYEADRAESMNKDQKDKLEEKVRVMKELQKEQEQNKSFLFRKRGDKKGRGT